MMKLNKLTLSQADTAREAYEGELRKLREEKAKQERAIQEQGQREQETELVYATFSEEIERLNKVLGEAMQDSMRSRK